MPENLRTQHANQQVSAGMAALLSNATQAELSYRRRNLQRLHREMMQEQSAISALTFNNKR